MQTRKAMQAIQPHTLPINLLFTRKWLLVQGVQPHRLDNWLKSGKMVSLAQGIYMRQGSYMTWQGVAASMQYMELQSAFVGGVSALEQGGMSHYIPVSKTIYMFGAGKAPTWLSRLNLEVDFAWRDITKLWNIDILMSTKNIRSAKWQPGLPSYQLATPELAFMQLLEYVPQRWSFAFCEQIMQGLVSMSPAKLDALLMHCKSIKVKRLFLYFAREAGYKWYQHLKTELYDLGSGKRVIAKGGRLDPELLITVDRNAN